MLKVLFICHGSTSDSRELAALVGKTGQIAAVGKVGYYGFTTSEETKKEPLLGQHS